MVPGVATWVGRLLGADSGADDLFAMRVLMMLLSVVAVWVVYLLTRDAFDSRVAGVAAATSLLAFQGFVTYATGGPREKTTMMLLMALALWAVVHRRWGWAGVAVALATLTWQPVFFGALGAAFVGALLVRGRPRHPRRPGPVRRRRHRRPPWSFVVYYVAVGALRGVLGRLLRDQRRRTPGRRGCCATSRTTPPRSSTASAGRCG